MVKLVNRAKMTTATTGTGPLALGSAVDGFQSFAAAGVSNGDLVRYVIEDGDAWEIGTGSYNAAGPSLTRNATESSVGGAAIALAGEASVFLTATAADLDAKLETSDPRLSDAREWTASTVTQAEAETGTATTRRAFTAQRIRQAVLAWWADSADKSKLDGIAAGAQVNTVTSVVGKTGAVTLSATDVGAASASHSHTAATTSVAGFLSATDKSKLDGIAAGAQVNVGTDLAMGGSGNTRTITSSTGTNVAVPVASTANAGFMSTDDKTKLDGLSGSTPSTLASLTDTNISAPAFGDVLFFNSASWVNIDPDSAGLVATAGNQTIGGTKTFSSAVVLSTAGSATNHAVRADRDIGTSTGLSGGGNLTANRTISLLNIAAGSSTSGALFYNGTTRSAGRLYGGTTNPASTTRLNYDGNLHVNALTAVGDVTAFSDVRLKTDLERIPDALAKVSRLTGYTYTRKDTGARQTGVVAQDVQKVLPEAVIDSGDHLAVAYGNMIGLLIEAIKELAAQIERLEAR